MIPSQYPQSKAGFTTFGGCQEFTLVQADPEQRKIISIQQWPRHRTSPACSRAGARAGSEVIIVGGIGGRALAIFAKEGIEVRAGEPDATVEALAAAYLDGRLVNEPKVAPITMMTGAGTIITTAKPSLSRIISRKHSSTNQPRKDQTHVKHNTRIPGKFKGDSRR